MKLRIPDLTFIVPETSKVSFSYARGSYMHKLIKKGGLAYEPDVSALLVSLGMQKSNTAFINIGANISYFPVLLGAIFGDAFEIHTFEPMPYLFDMGVDGIQQNGITANSRPLALSNFVGEAQFHLSAQTDSSNSLNPTFRKHKSVIDVEVSSIDEVFIQDRQSVVVAELLDGRSNESACTMVIDTESTEPDVLEGGAELISRIRPNIICEVLSGRTEDRLQTIIDEHGYYKYRLTDDGLVAEDTIVGDLTYQHRDWFFSPEPIDEQLCERYSLLVGRFASSTPFGARSRTALLGAASRLRR